MVSNLGIGRQILLLYILFFNLSITGYLYPYYQVLIPVQHQEPSVIFLFFFCSFSSLFLLQLLSSQSKNPLTRTWYSALRLLFFLYIIIFYIRFFYYYYSRIILRVSTVPGTACDNILDIIIIKITNHFFIRIYSF